MELRTTHHVTVETEDLTANVRVVLGTYTLLPLRRLRPRRHKDPPLWMVGAVEKCQCQRMGTWLTRCLRSDKGQTGVRMIAVAVPAVVSA